MDDEEDVGFDEDEDMFVERKERRRESKKESEKKKKEKKKGEQVFFLLLHDYSPLLFPLPLQTPHFRYFFRLRNPDSTTGP